MSNILSRKSVLAITADAAAYCKEARVPGSWSGSAFRNHPCGLIRGTIKVTNDWHTSNSCSICITDGTGWSRDFCTDSCAHGNPHPMPIGGRSIVVWRNGEWESEEYRMALEEKVAQILADAREHVLRYRNWQAVEKQAAKEKYESDLLIAKTKALQAAIA